MKRCRRRLVWVALWMAVIFLFSAQTSQRSKELSGAVMEQLTTQQTDAPSAEETPEQEFLHTLIRKGAHFAEYAVLSMLVAYAIWDLDLPKKVRWLLPVAVATLGKKHWHSASPMKSSSTADWCRKATSSAHCPAKR